MLKLIPKFSFPLFAILSFLLYSLLAQADLPPSCAMRPLEEPRWVYPSKQLSNQQFTVDIQQNFRNETSQFHRTWRGSDVTFHHLTYSLPGSPPYPAMQVDIPGEKNYFYFVKIAIPGAKTFEWKEARAFCKAMVDPQISTEKNSWDLPIRTRRDQFDFLTADPKFLASPGQINIKGNTENLYVLFVREAEEAKNTSCYDNTLMAYAFTPSYYIDTFFGLTDEDFKNRSQNAEQGAKSLPVLSLQAATWMVRYVFRTQIVQDTPDINRKIEASIKEILSKEQAEAIYKIYKAAINDHQKSETAITKVEDYVLGQKIAWMRIYSDEKSNAAIVDSLLKNLEYPLAHYNNDIANDGGVEVVCVAEGPKAPQKPFSQ